MPFAVGAAESIHFSSGNKKVYVVGGAPTWLGPNNYAGSAYDPCVVQAYNPASQTWETVVAQGYPSKPHKYFGLAEASGQMFIVDPWSATSSYTEETTATVNNGFVTGQAIQLSIESFNASQNVTPVYRSIVLRGALRPRGIGIISAQIRAGDNVPDRNGSTMRPGANILEDLRAVAKAAAPVQLSDLSGATNWVVVQQPVDESAVWQEGQENPEMVASIKMTVMDFSAA